jgi:RNA polymerase sigma factor (sigma-70 family)
LKPNGYSIPVLAPTDEQLARLVCGPEPEASKALELLLLRSTPVVAKAIRATRLSGQGIQQVRDAMKAAALVAIWEAARSFEGGHGASFATFVYPRVLDAVLRAAQLKRPGPSVRADSELTDLYDSSAGVEPSLTPPPTPYQSLELAALRRTVQNYVMTLPVRDRQLLADLYWREMTQAQVARNLGVSKVAVGKRLRRLQRAARTALRPLDYAVA